MLLKILCRSAGDHDPLKTSYTQLNFFQLVFFDKHLISRKKRSCKEWTENRYISGFVTTQHSNFFFFKKKELYSPFQSIEFKCINSVEPFQGDNSLLLTKSLGVSGTLLFVDLTMKTPGSFKPANPGLLIRKHLIILLLFNTSKVIYKRFQILTEQINRTHLLPIKTSYYSSEVYHVM